MLSFQKCLIFRYYTKCLSTLTKLTVEKRRSQVLKRTVNLGQCELLGRGVWAGVAGGHALLDEQLHAGAADHDLWSPPKFSASR